MLRRLTHLQHACPANASVSELLRRLASQKAGGKNVAQGDTTKPSAGKEVGNVAKGDELTLAENLKYNTITHPAQAFEGDLRSTSGLGLGDGLYTHTSKWLQVSRQFIQPRLCCGVLVTSSTTGFVGYVALSVLCHRNV